MGRPAQDITESELAVLRILWDRGTATIRQLTDILYPGGEAAQYATVQKLLDRMEAKGYVRRDRTLYVHVFTAVLDRDQFIGRRLRSLAEMLCDGSLTPLLTHLARAKDLTEKDRLALRAIMDEIEADPELCIERERRSRKRSAEASRNQPRRLVRARPEAGAVGPPANDDTAPRGGSPSHGIARACHAEQCGGRDGPGRAGGDAGPSLPPAGLDSWPLVGGHAQARHAAARAGVAAGRR